MVIAETSVPASKTQSPLGVLITILCTSSICSTLMPSFFIIAFIWRGLIFPGSILVTPLPYSYRYSVIKCKHFRAGNDRCTTGKEPVVAGDNQNIVPRADCGVRRDHVLCKRVLAFLNKF